MLDIEKRSKELEKEALAKKVTSQIKFLIKQRELSKENFQNITGYQEVSSTKVFIDDYSTSHYTLYYHQEAKKYILVRFEEVHIIGYELDYSKPELVDQFIQNRKYLMEEYNTSTITGYWFVGLLILILSVIVVVAGSAIGFLGFFPAFIFFGINAIVERVKLIENKIKQKVYQD